MDGGCPVLVAQELLAAMVALADRDPAKVRWCLLWKTALHVVVVLTLSRMIKSVETGQAPVTLELRNTRGKKHKQTEGGTRMCHG